jgi:hypothetical protein
MPTRRPVQTASVEAAQDSTPTGAGSRTRAIHLICRAMRHQRQPIASLAPILDAATHHEEDWAEMSWGSLPAAFGADQIGSFAGIAEHLQ